MTGRDCKNCVNCDLTRGFMCTCHYSYDETQDGKKKRQEMWYFNALKSGADRSKVRSKTFHGVARAMAEQWGNNDGLSVKE